MSTDYLTTSMIALVKPNLDVALKTAVDEVDALILQMDAAAADASGMSEVEMMAFNVAVSRFNTLVTLMSGVYKNLCDGEKTIAQKM